MNIEAEREAMIAEALSVIKQDYSKECLQMATTKQYVEDAICQLVDAGYRSTCVELKRGTTHPQPAADVVAYRMEMRAGDYSYMDAKHWSYNGQHYTGSRVHELVLGRCIQNPGVPIEVAAVLPSMWSGVRPDTAAPSEGAKAEKCGECEECDGTGTETVYGLGGESWKETCKKCFGQPVTTSNAAADVAVSQAAAPVESVSETQPLASSADASLSTKLWCDLKTDAERSNWLLLGRGYETGVVAKALQNDLAMAYHRLWLLATPAAAVELPPFAKTEKGLLPCPFCGGEPELYIGCSDVFVNCLSCNSYGTTYIHTKHPDFQNMDTAKSKAIASWNRRAAVALAAQAGEGKA